MDEEIKVSVICTAYNHEKYIRRCLEGFICQKTSFKYEVLVNDDRSVDNTAEIIKEFALKYPEIIKPVYQTENQFSKGIWINDDILFPLAQGEYIALCEGDDYWCNENKLQLQYDYMASHPECSMVMHNTVKHDLREKYVDKNFNNWSDIHVMTDDEIFFSWLTHTSSYFYRRKCAIVPPFGRPYWSGDYVRITWASYYGTVVSLPQIMSVYNYGVASGMTMGNLSSSFSKGIKRLEDRILYLSSLNSYTDLKKNEVITRKIEEDSFSALRLKKMEVIVKTKRILEAVSAAKDVKKDSRYKCFINSKGKYESYKERFKYEGYFCYPIWKWYLEKRYSYRL